MFDEAETEITRLVEHELPLPAYEQVIFASHFFNLLDARHAISVTERQRYILRVRTLSRKVAEAFYAKREALGFPLANNPNTDTHVAFSNNSNAPKTLPTQTNNGSPA